MEMGLGTSKQKAVKRLSSQVTKEAIGEIHTHRSRVQCLVSMARCGGNPIVDLG